MTLLFYFVLPTLLLVFLTVLATRLLLPILRKKKLGQRILEIGPVWHKKKEGTPTMGGIAFLPVAALFLLVPILFLSAKEGFYNACPLLFTAGFVLLTALIGVRDDSLKLLKKQNEGLTPGQKLLLQTAVSGLYLFLMRAYGFVTTETVIPFLNLSVDLGFFYDFIVLFLSVGIINCANLTDGVDGLLSSVSIPLGLGYAGVAVLLGSNNAYILSLLLVGIPIGFLFFNLHPAKLFMGDTGSLFFGALAVGCSLLLNRPLLLMLLPLVYIIEGVSDVLQVAFFKISGGKRLLKMAPLHHHLEAKGYGEGEIVFRFTFIGFLSAGAVLLSVLWEVMA